MLIALGIAILVILAVVAIAATRHPRPAIGRLSRETRARDRSAPCPRHDRRGPDGARTPDRGRARRAAVALRPASPPAHADRTPARPIPTDGELGITRRQFFNRSILAGTGLGLGAFGVASLAFLWPSASTGFGGKINIGSEAAAKASIASKTPYYSADAKAYVVAYPSADLAKAKKVSAYTRADPRGHGGRLRRPLPEVSAPRLPRAVVPELAMVRVPLSRLEVQRGGREAERSRAAGHGPVRVRGVGGDIIVDTGNIVLGPPIGTNTINQSPAGPLCV